MAVVLLSAFACSDKSTNSGGTFSGIMRTDESGNVLGGDLNDWCFGIVYAAAKIPEPPVPTEFALYAAYPNPCNGSVSIVFDMPIAAEANLVVKSSKFTVVTHLYTNEPLDAGTYTVVWDLTNDNQEKLADGIYRVYLSVADFECYGDIQILHPN